MANRELEPLLREGIAAARAGENARARDLLLQVIARDEENETAWLWLSGVVDDPEERQICLENVLTLNPDNRAARAGLRHLAEGDRAASEEPATRPPAPPLPSPRPVLAAIPDETTEPPPRPSSAAVEIDPFGCPYCAGSIREDEPRCAHCGRLVTLRHRKRAPGAWLSWLVLSFVVLAVASWGESFLVAQLVDLGRLPEWLTQSAVRFLVGSALFQPDGVPGELVEFAGTFALVNNALAALCLLAAGGLALRIRVVYFGSLVLLGLLVVGIGVGLLSQLAGWVPALFRLGLVALALRWLVDSAPGFEWETRAYDADLDRDLRKDLDYYSRGVRYRDLGMWAKAAAHWKVAGQLEPGKAEYRAALANAYARMGYPDAALAEADKALQRFPEDSRLRAFRDALAKAITEDSP